MIVRTAGVLFKIVTLPGLATSTFLQTLFDDRYGVPSGRVAVETGVDLDSVDPDEESSVARVLEDGEGAGDGEVTRYVTDYNAVERYSVLRRVVVAPFAITSLLAALSFAVADGLLTADVLSPDGLLRWLPVWLGFSLAVHAVPDAAPAAALWRASRETAGPLRLGGSLVGGFALVANAMRFPGSAVLYALALWLLVGVAFGAPQVVPSP